MADPGLLLTIEIEAEEDGRTIAAIPELPGVLAYGGDHDEAIRAVKCLALRTIAERLESEEKSARDFSGLTFHITYVP